MRCMLYPSTETVKNILLGQQPFRLISQIVGSLLVLTPDSGGILLDCGAGTVARKRLSVLLFDTCLSLTSTVIVA